MAYDTLFRELPVCHILCVSFYTQVAHSSQYWKLFAYVLVSCI